MNSLSLTIVKRNETQTLTFVRRVDTQDDVYEYEQAISGGQKPEYYVELKQKGISSLTEEEKTREELKEAMNQKFENLLQGFAGLKEGIEPKKLDDIWDMNDVGNDGVMENKESRNFMQYVLTYMEDKQWDKVFPDDDDDQKWDLVF